MVYINSAARAWRYSLPKPAVDSGYLESPVRAFHRLLPHYAETPLHSLPSVAKHLGLGHVFVKDESQRFGLPSFKILGASWAVYRAVADRLGLDALSLLTENGSSLDLSSLGLLARDQGLRLRLVTCTEGNWGRAVARMASYLGVPATVYVPAHMHEITRERIRGEGADVKVVDGDYDAAVAAAQGAAESEGSLLVMDISWEGYETVPQVCSTFPRTLCLVTISISADRA
jgi:diaminopropionate ammonia-lyase